MENKINRKPFKMDQIPAKLFNSQYLSDITFIIEGKQIYAHSLLLMVRSSVFEQQLEQTLGESKLIPITDYGYNAFYQFIRFLYTDQMDISDVDWFNLMKLAKKYNVISLVEYLMMNNFSTTLMFNVCALETYKIVLKTLKHGSAGIFDKILQSDDFLSVHPDVLEEILKLDLISEGITESFIMDALVRWMKHHCKQTEIQFSECRIKFDHLFRLIRFPTMSNDELKNIKTKYPELLTKSDFLNIAGHKMYGAKYDKGAWNSISRINFIWPYELKTYQDIPRGEIAFYVFSNMVLGGFVFGAREQRDNQPINITFCYRTFYTGAYSIPIELGIGALISVQPGFMYKISWSCETAKTYWIRKPETDLIVNAPSNSVIVKRAHPIMFEILFLKPDGSTFDELVQK